MTPGQLIANLALSRMLPDIVHVTRFDDEGWNSQAFQLYYVREVGGKAIEWFVQISKGQNINREMSLSFRFFLARNSTSIEWTHA